MTSAISKGLFICYLTRPAGSCGNETAATTATIATIAIRIPDFVRVTTLTKIVVGSYHEIVGSVLIEIKNGALRSRTFPKRPYIKAAAAKSYIL